VAEVSVSPPAPVLPVEPLIELDAGRIHLRLRDPRTADAVEHAPVRAVLFDSDRREPLVAVVVDAGHVATGQRLAPSIPADHAARLTLPLVARGEAAVLVAVLALGSR
jgi:hypothetical protein